MITVLIADDEHLLRKLILSSVEWEELGLEAVGEVGDGESALAFIRDKAPDIAILDINMPFLNGIELAGAVFREHLPVRLLILTGYRDFEYARMAVTYHVRDYLLKPIQPKELNAALKRMAEEVRYERSLRSAAQVLRGTRAEEYLHKQSLMKELMGGARDADTLASLRLLDAPCRALVVRPDVSDVARDLDQELLRLLYLARDVFAEAGFEHVEGYVEEDAYAVLLVNAPDDCAQRVKACAEQVLTASGAPVSVGVSCALRDLGDAAQGVQQALVAMNDRFYQPRGRVYCAWEEAPQTRTTGVRETAMQVLDIHQMVKNTDWVRTPDLFKLLDRAFEAMRSQRMNEDYVKMSAVSFVTALFTQGVMSENAQPAGRGGSVIGRIMGCATFDELKRATLEVFDANRDLMQRGGNTPALSRRVGQAKTYIEENYAESGLSLNRLAGALYVNSTYISNQFRKEMHITITEYITACRMRAAVRIIGEEPETALVEVAQRVGYRDPYYFSKSFKKYYGVTPKRYAPTESTSSD